MAKANRFIHNKGNTAICYYRYSSDAQREESIEQQQEAAREYAEQHGYHIIREYKDKAISGTTDKRKGLQLILQEAKTLRPAYLILWKTDWLSRDELDISEALLEMNGVAEEAFINRQVHIEK